jgi:hypothetical protein
MIQRRTATKTPARKPASAGSGAAARKATARPRPKTKVPPALALAPASDADAASLYELAALAARSQREAFDIVHERVNVNIDEVQRLLRSSERPPVTPKETPP